MSQSPISRANQVERPILSAHDLAAAVSSRREGVPARCQAVLMRLQALPILRQVGRYGLVSIVALAIDCLVFTLIIGLGQPATLAAVAGYFTGLIVHYGLTRTFVFDRDRTGKSEQRLFAEFAVTGVIGLGVTWAVVAVIVNGYQIMPLIGKIAATCASFAVVFVMRRFWVFRTAQA